MQVIILIPYISIHIYIFAIFVSKNMAKVCQEKKITFEVFIASCGSSFQAFKVIPPQLCFLCRVLTLWLTTSL